MMKWLLLILLGLGMLTACNVSEDVEEVDVVSPIPPLTRADYLQVERTDNTQVRYMVKNPEESNLTLEQFRNKTMVDGVSSLDFNISVVEGGYTDKRLYTIENFRVPNIVRVWVNNYTGTGRFRNTTFENFTMVQNGTKVEEREVVLNEDKFQVEPGVDREIFMDFKPLIKRSPWGGWVSKLNVNPWFNLSFSNRINITFNNSAQSEDLIDFPVLIVLNSSIVNYSKTQDNGEDIRFTDSDGETILDHEIELWNESGRSYVWVRVPQIDASSSTDLIFMYYGDSATADGQNAAGVWVDYIAVWHMEEDPSGTAPQILDSTSDKLNGTSSGSMTSSDLVEGFISKGIDFDGIDDVIDIPSFTLQVNFTYTMWVSNTNDNTFSSWLADSNARRWIGIEATNLNDWESGGSNTFGAAPSSDNFHMRVARYNRTEPDIFQYIVNQTQQGADLADQNYGTETGVWEIGGGTDPANAIVDEVRISNLTRTWFWINATWLSSTNQFNTYGAEQDSPADPGLVTTVTNEGISGGDDAFQMHTHYSSDKDRWYRIYIESDQDIHLQSASNNNLSNWTDGGDIFVGSFDYEDFDCSMDSLDGSGFLHCIVNPGGNVNITYVRINLTDTSPFISVGSEQIIRTEPNESDQIFLPRVVLDSNRCLLVSYIYRNLSLPSSTGRLPRMIKENGTCGDGVWATNDFPSGFPLIVDPVGNNNPLPNGIFSFGDLDAMIIWIDRSAGPSAASLEANFFNGTTNALDGLFTLATDVEYENTVAPFATVITNNGRIVTFAANDNEVALQARILENKTDQTATVVDTGINVSVVDPNSGPVTAFLDNASGNIWVFAIDSNVPQNVFYAVSSDEGDTWVNQTLFVDSVSGINEVKFFTSDFNSVNCTGMVSWLGNDASPFTVSFQTVDTGNACDVEEEVAAASAICTVPATDPAVVQCNCSINFTQDMGQRAFIANGTATNVTLTVNGTLFNFSSATSQNGCNFFSEAGGVIG